MLRDVGLGERDVQALRIVCWPDVVLPWALQGVRPTGEVLEIGAGSGAMSAGLLSKFPDVSVVATDYDADMLAAASRSLSPMVWTRHGGAG